MSVLGKRIGSGMSDTISKLAKNTELLWLSPSDLKNTILDNLLVDYLNRVGEIVHGFTRGSIEFNSSLFDLGNRFESLVISNIRSSGIPIKEITNIRSYEKWPETVRALREGVPIIYQGPLVSESRRYRGIPDLLVRSDYVNKLFKNPVMEEGTRLGYVVIDIKFSTLPLLKNNTILRSEPKTKLYKSQLWMYNEMLKEVLGYGFDYAFILGRGLEWVGNRVNTYDVSPGKVVFDDEFRKEMIELIEKKRRFENYINQIKLEDALILPNMKVPEQYDEGWSHAKRAIAEKHGEITLLPNCGIKQREKALALGITNFRDQRCTSSVLGIGGPILSRLVDKVLWINQRSDMMVNPLSIGNLDWKKPNGIDLFVDFETVGDLCAERFETLPASQKGNIAFLIGVGWYVNEVWNFKKFLVRKIDFDEERHIFNNFAVFVNEMKGVHGNARLFHWGHIEASHFKKVQELHKVRLQANWIDMCKELKNIPVVVSGAFGFGLKEYARAMYRNGLIDIKWTEGVGSHDIMNRMIGKWGIVVKEEEHADVIKYNEEDCQVMSAIIKYFQKYH